MAVMIIVWAVFILFVVAALAFKAVRGERHPSDLLFQPRVIYPGYRLGEYRRKRALTELQKPEGNEIGWKFGDPPNRHRHMLWNSTPSGNNWVRDRFLNTDRCS